MKGKVVFPASLDGVHIHFVGIKGTGMVALVEICKARGAVISGSDVAERFYTDTILENLSIVPTVFSSENIKGDIKVIVYSSAYKLDKNCELIEAQKKNIPCILYSEALGQISALSKSSGIAGVHGKTTTTGLTGIIIQELNLPAQVLAGSAIKQFGNCTLSLGKDYFVAETCEYQRHFMAFHPVNVILTSVESDHQDYYPTFKDIQNAFVDYCCLLPENGNLIYCADDKGAEETVQIVRSKRSDINFISYGFSAEGEYRIIECRVESGGQFFRLNQNPAFEFELRIPGIHNVRNASAAIALTQILLSDQYKKNYFKEFSDSEEKNFLGKTRDALKSFAGSKRRSEIVGSFKNSCGEDVVVIDDYGHHPTAIKTTLEGFRAFYPDKYIIVDFMSHTYSRTASLFEEFASSFESADEVILHKIYSSARENPKDFPNVSGKVLFEKVSQNYPEKKVSYFEEILDAAWYISKKINETASDPNPGKNGYVLITMGAGDNWKLGSKILEMNN